MKQLNRTNLMAFVVALLLILTVATPVGRADEAHALPCTVSFSDPSVIVGNNVTVNVRVSGQVGAATIHLVFDPSYLQYVNGDLGTYGKHNGNTITLDKENAGSGNMSFSMTFKALKTGKTSIDCTGYDISDGTTDPQSMNVNMGNSVVTINAPYTASGNNNLSSLSISPGTLSPGFSAGTTSYSASVSNSTTSVAVSAKAADGKAKVAVWGNTGLDVGNNTVTVQVTAENGSKKTYTITVNRAAGSTGGNTGGNAPAPDDTPSPSPTATPEPQVTVTLPDDTQLPVSNQLPEGVTLPQGFETSQLEVDGQTIPTAVHQDGGLVAVYLAGDEGHPAGFYFYNEKTREVQAMTPVAMSTGKLTLVDLPQELVIPQGYTSTLMELGGQQHTLLVPDDTEEPNHYIVYAMDEEGKLGLYLYDVEQESFQRYQFTQLGDAPLVLAEVAEEPQSEGFVFTLFGREIRTGWSNRAVSYLLVGVTALAVVLLVAVIVLVVCLVKARKALHLAWMRQEEERQRRIIQGTCLSVDEILAEHTSRNAPMLEDRDSRTLPSQTQQPTPETIEVSWQEAEPSQEDRNHYN